MLVILLDWFTHSKEFESDVTSFPDGSDGIGPLLCLSGRIICHWADKKWWFSIGA